MANTAPRFLFDVTKSRRQRHHSGLNRVSQKLLEHLSGRTDIDLRKVRWSVFRRSYIDVESRESIGRGTSSDRFFTPETFSFRERLFCESWMRRFRGTSAVVFHDAIPYFHPNTTWPKSVKRFPHWFRGLNLYDKVFFVSEQSRLDAANVSRGYGIEPITGPLFPLGGDYLTRKPVRNPSGKFTLVHVGIIEPRKGHDVLLGACEELWSAGNDFKLVLLGRANPHFGKGILDRIEQLQSSGRDIIHEKSVRDDGLADWHSKASLTVSPSRAEGFGLPVMESLWAGCPVVSSRQPCLEFLPTLKGVRVLEDISVNSLVAAIRPLMEDYALLKELSEEVAEATLPTWDACVDNLLQELG